MKPHAFTKGLMTSLALLWGAASAADDTSMARLTLKEHNAARAEFGSPPLQWSSRLAEEAQRWAAHLAQTNSWRHSKSDQRRGAGENLWRGSRGYFKPSQMIASFVDERVDFVPGRFPEVSRTGYWTDVGHYTQIVWPETREVGCALATGERFDVLVCRYWPAGNRIGATISPREKVAALD